MPVEQAVLGRIFLFSTVLGFGLGIVYDFFRIRRIFFKTMNPGNENKVECVVIFFEDVLYSLISAVVVCIFVFYTNSGRYRALTFIGAIFGFYIYRKTLGRLFVIVFGYIFSFIKLIIKLLGKYVVYPIYRVLAYIFSRTLGRLIKAIYTVIIKQINYRNARNVYNILREHKHLKNKGRIKHEKAVKYISESNGGSVHSILHSHHNKNAV